MMGSLVKGARAHAVVKRRHLDTVDPKHFPAMASGFSLPAHGVVKLALMRRSTIVSRSASFVASWQHVALVRRKATA